jgi:PAS domain S-box-containing protein
MNAVSKAPAAMPSVVPRVQKIERDHHDHVVQFYGDDSALIEALVRFVGSALRAGDAGIVIATEPHREELARRMQAEGINVDAAVAQGRYIVLDAAATLSAFMVDGLPDPALFEEQIGKHVRRAREAVGDRNPRVVAFGEMVAILFANGQREAALALERLWSKLSKAHSFSLRCAYPIKEFSRGIDREFFVEICDEHLGVIPSEGYTMLSTEDERLRSIAELQQKANALEAQVVLHRSAEQFRLLVESVQDYAIFMLDSEGHVATWNIGAERIKGYRASEIIGQHFSRFYPQEDIRSGKPQEELRVASAEGRFEDEGWRLRKDGSRFWANVVITALRDPSGNLKGFAKVTRDVTEKKHAIEAVWQTNRELQKEIEERIAAQRKLYDSEQSLRRLSGHLLRMQDEERRRFGRDLHDSVGQYLAALKMGLDAMGPESNPQIEECIHLVDESMKEVRTISYLLYPPMLEEMGLRSAIPWYLDGFSKRSGIAVTSDLDPEIGRLSRDAEVALFRVLQESLTNVHRHSGSFTASIRLALDGGKVCLEVSDAGKGIPPEVLESSRDPSTILGVGMRGMSERMGQLGGSLELSSNGHGATVRARVPRDTEDSD